MPEEKAAVFLDRDGVIVESILRGGRPYAPRTLAEFKFLPGVDSAIASLRKAGFIVIVVTNQPDVAHGKLKSEELDRMHALMKKKLPLDGVKTCLHSEEDRCACRKPKPGMLTEAAREQSIDLSRSFMVGDRWRDIDAGKAAGCRTILIGDGYGEREITADWKVASLPEAAKLILSRAG